MVKRVLVYRLGGLGDMVVALPALHVVARAFPDAERRLLTGVPSSARRASAEAVLGTAGTIHSYLCYPHGLRDWVGLLRLRNRIRHFRPDVLVYLAEARGLAKTVRDAIFFASCGVTKLVGLPLSARAQANAPAAGGLFEHEADRLVRCIRRLGGADLGHPASWDLQLTEAEQRRAHVLLAATQVRAPFLAVSIGTTVGLKDWGDDNWRHLLRRIDAAFPDVSLVFVGAAEEAERSQALAGVVRGAVANLCGAATPRESAAILREAAGFVGHDSGPMHLAAAMGTPTVAVFSSRGMPGVWFPYGQQHRIARPKAGCPGCTFNDCAQQERRCILSVSVEEVWARLSPVLGKMRRAARNGIVAA